MCLICASVSNVLGASGWAGFVSGTAFFTALIWFVLYLVNISSKFPPIMLVVVSQVILSLKLLSQGLLALVHVIAAEC